MKHASKNGLLFLLVAVVVTPAGLASAVDTKWVAGAWCIPEDEDQTSFVTDNYGQFLRGVNSTRNLQCPILRDNTTNENGLDSLSMEVLCPTNVTVSCTATSRNAWSTTLDYATDSCSGDDVGSHPLTWDSVTSSGSPGYYHFACTISGTGSTGGIVSYEWVEP